MHVLKEKNDPGCHASDLHFLLPLPSNQISIILPRSSEHRESWGTAGPPDEYNMELRSGHDDWRVGAWVSVRVRLSVSLCVFCFRVRMELERVSACVRACVCA